MLDLSFDGNGIEPFRHPGNSSDRLQAIDRPHVCQNTGGDRKQPHSMAPGDFEHRAVREFTKNQWCHTLLTKHLTGSLNSHALLPVLSLIRCLCKSGSV